MIKQRILSSCCGAAAVLALTACSPSGVSVNAATPDYWLNKDLAGPDANHNGIRDDVDAWITKQSYSAPQRRAVEQASRAFQYEISAEFKNKDEVRSAANRDIRALDCLYKKFSDGHAAYKQLTAILVNTRERILMQDKNNTMASGMTFTIRDVENSCD